MQIFVVLRKISKEKKVMKQDIQRIMLAAAKPLFLIFILYMLKIVEVGEANGVYIMEDKPLARGLYASVEVDMEIPEEFYQTVAKVLAFVYKLKKKDI